LSHPIRCFTVLTDNGIHSSIESASTAALGGGIREPAGQTRKVDVVLRGLES